MAMERTRVAKVEDVTLCRRGEQVVGTLHLTPHHLIFVHTPPQPAEPTSRPPPRPRELWLTYPIIAFCTLRAAHPASRQPSSIRLRCRDFTFICFYFPTETKARDVYDSIRAWTCKLGRLEKLYAFSYKPVGAEAEINSWGLYDPMKEWRRMGVGEGSGGSQWRISKINHDYAFSPTYPTLLPVPASISDITLKYDGAYRSRARIPVLTYLHPVNQCSITRCSQPMVGIKNNRSIQDEKLLAAIFSTTRAERPLSSLVASPPPEREDSMSSKDTAQSPPSADSDLQRTDTEAFEDAVISKFRGDDEAAEDKNKPLIYGAQQRNMIVDARPTVNAYAMQAVGLGSENMDNYKFATKAYLGIENIHVMRDSLNRVVDTLKDSDLTPLPPNREALARSGWLKHVATVLDGVGLITRQVGLQHSHVLIHCSDGWDRTSQLSSLAQICLDPYYRTIDGFIVLVEKDWLGFGHQFNRRSGPLSSEKWFQIENERIGGRDDETDSPGRGNDAMAGAQKRIENALLSAKGFFSTKQHNDSRESLNIDSDNEVANPYDSDPVSASKRSVLGGHKRDKSLTSDTKPKETSPVFHQFLDCTYQLMYQHPSRFEYNDRFLRRLLYHLYSCQYGTFLYDCEKARVDARLSEKTRSVWDYFLARRTEFTNPDYDGGNIDDNVRGKERLIFPHPEDVRWWHSAFGRTDDEMNGRSAKPDGYDDYGMDSSNGGYTAEEEEEQTGPQTQKPEQEEKRANRTPVLTAVEINAATVTVPAANAPKEASDALKADIQTAVADKIPDSVSASSSTSALDAAIDLARTHEAEYKGPPSPAPAHEGEGEDEPTSKTTAAEEAVDLDLDPLGITSTDSITDRPVMSRSQRDGRLRKQMEVLLQ